MVAVADEATQWVAGRGPQPDPSPRSSAAPPRLARLRSGSARPPSEEEEAAAVASTLEGECAALVERAETEA